MIFAQNLQDLRRQAGLSQEALAEKLGWAAETIAAYEQGLLQPGPAELVYNLLQILRRNILAG